MLELIKFNNGDAPFRVRQSHRLIRVDIIETNVPIKVWESRSGDTASAAPVKGGFLHTLPGAECTYFVTY